MDPRISTSLADLAKQFEMQSGAVEGMNESYETLEQVQSVRAQLKDRAAKAGKGAVANAIAALDKQAAQIERETQSVFFGLAPSGKQPETLSTLNQHFGAILAVADSADAAPTTQATAVYNELEGALESLLSRWTKLRQDEIPSLNTFLKNANLLAIDPNLPLVNRPSSDEDGDDEP
jgi:membrane-bound lytic murein transglycosylase